MKIIKTAFRLLLLLIVGVVLYTVYFINTSPQFGQLPTEDQKLAYSKTGHHNGEVFLNAEETNMDMDFLEATQEWLKESENRNPSENIEVEKVTPASLNQLPDSVAQLIWFGHSAFLLKMEGKNILLDPMLGNSPTPHLLFEVPRYSKELPMSIEDLPQIDAVIFSHDHYDHLDYGSVIKLKDKVEHFYVPLGLGNHLQSWGVEPSAITELDWWEAANFEGIELVLTPARHFSGRGFGDRLMTLWGSWVIRGQYQNLYFSGDGGYGKHFKEIGEKYGPFDLSLMECGQYNQRWKLIHMMPEETVQAAIDIKSKVFMPIHWGAFTLALHSWTDPAERATAEAQRLNIPVTTPKIGEPLILDGRDLPQGKWWDAY